MTRIDRDTYELSTGRRFYANRGILGLDPDPYEDDWQSRLTGGYDQSIDEGRPSAGEHGDPAGILTPAERREIAEYQIKLWAEWGGVTQ